MNSFLLNFNSVQELPNWLVILIFSIPFVGGIFLYFFKTRHASQWRKGIFPPNLKPNEDNFLEAYLALGAKMMILDYKASKGKVQYINKYFSQYFKFANYNFSDSLVFSFRHPIKTTTVTHWMKKHITSEGGRSQIVYFLAGIAMIEGKLNKNELNFLKQINKELELEASNLIRIMSMYASFFQQSQEKEKSRSSSRPNKYSHEILGVTLDADASEIKRAYRKLVKIHHPDNFATSSLSQQKIAEEKFIEIQRAYEELVK